MQVLPKIVNPALGLLGLMVLAGSVHADPRIIGTYAQRNNARVEDTAGSGTAKGAVAAAAPRAATAYTIPNGFNFNCDSLKFSADAIENGRRAFMRLNCNVCHAGNGHGGTMGPSLVGKGDDVSDSVPNGEDNGMPAFKKYLCPTDIANLTAYVNSLGTKGSPDFTDWWVAHPPAPFVDSAP